jgi:threonine synthase
VLAALRASGGTAVAVGEDALTRAQLLTGRLLGSYVAAETGAALAALPVLRERGELAGGEEVVVFDCGIGQKYPLPAAGLPAPEVVAA